jgi:hypothetical protein
MDNLVELAIQALLGIGFLIGGLLILYQSYRLYVRRQVIKDAPTEKLRSVSQGLSELKGLCKPKEEYAENYYNDKKCAAFKMVVEKEDQSDEGSDWRTVYQEEKKTPFILKDDTGEITVDLTEDSNIQYFEEEEQKEQNIIKERYDSKDELEGDLGVTLDNLKGKEDSEGMLDKVEDVAESIAHTDYRTRIKSIYFDENVYVLGGIKQGEDGQYVGQSIEDIFLVSNQEEENKLQKELIKKVLLYILIGIFASIIGIVAVGDLILP